MLLTLLLENSYCLVFMQAVFQVGRILCFANTACYAGYSKAYLYLARKLPFLLTIKHYGKLKTEESVDIEKKVCAPSVYKWYTANRSLYLVTV